MQLLPWVPYCLTMRVAVMPYTLQRSPAISDQELFPSQPVVIIAHGETDATVRGNVGKKHKDTVGIVDPFLAARVRPGERFAVYLMPRTITALSHKWF